jgi:hypothetical protein
MEPEVLFLLVSRQWPHVSSKASQVSKQTVKGRRGLGGVPPGNSYAKVKGPEITWSV